MLLSYLTFILRSKTIVYNSLSQISRMHYCTLQYGIFYYEKTKKKNKSKNKPKKQNKTKQNKTKQNKTKQQKETKVFEIAFLAFLPGLLSIYAQERFRNIALIFTFFMSYFTLSHKLHLFKEHCIVFYCMVVVFFSAARF